MKRYTQKEWEAMTNPLKKELDTTDFDLACGYFKQICGDIGKLMGEENFKGGYDDMPRFYAHPTYKTAQGMQLAIAWAGANEFCNHEAKKLNLDSPQWWYKCWSENE